MKILHTSDWHIGKHLHQYDLSEDLSHFFDWLIRYIQDQEIDVLLVSGDVFDQANPSQAAFKQYYDVLRRLIPLQVKVIITGGNHDSAAALNAPADLLQAFDVSIIGGHTHLKNLFISHQVSQETLVVAAVPYLRDRDLRKSVAGESYDTKIEQIKNGLKTYFSEVVTHYQSEYQDSFFIVMGHLYVQGSQLSESERDIQLGNLAGVAHDIFGEAPHYVALGHIHRPQVISQSRNVHYCGSPIPLSFSEKEDCKQINVLTVKNQELVDFEAVPIPSFRKLLHFKGTLEEVKRKIRSYQNPTLLPSLAEVHVYETQANIDVQYAFEEFINSKPNPHLEIVKTRLQFENQTSGSAAAFEKTTDVSDVTPLQMFEKRLELEGPLENKDELLLAFRELLEDLNL